MGQHHWRDTINAYYVGCSLEWAAGFMRKHEGDGCS